MDSQESKPLAPDRPGRYLLHGGLVATLFHNQAMGKWMGLLDCENLERCWLDTGEHTSGIINLRIVARAPDDAAWCLAQARLLCPKGYVVVPVEPTEAMQEAGCAAHDAYGLNPKWETDHRPMTASAYRAMIASAVEGK